MRKLLPILSLLLLLEGCGSKKYYTLGSTINVKNTATYEKEIDVVKVNVPKYLRDHTLVRQISPYQVEIIDKAQWLTPMQKRLTNVLIDYLQKSMNNPNVHLYPWTLGKKLLREFLLLLNDSLLTRTKLYLKQIIKLKIWRTKQKVQNSFVPQFKQAKTLTQ